MPAWLAPAIAGGASAFGRLLSQRKGVPQWLIDNIREQIAATRRSSFLPDRSAFRNALDARVAGYTQQLPVQLENYRANQASRGIFTSGEASAAEYRDVYAPVATGIAGAVGESQLGYESLALQGQMAQQQVLQNYMQMLVGATLNKQPSALNVLGSFLGEGGDLGLQLQLLRGLGLLDFGGGDGEEEKEWY